MTGRMVVLKFRPIRRNSLRGFVDVQFPSGLVISEVAIHQLGSRVWAAPPGRPMLDRDGIAMRGDEGKIRYSPIVSFMNHGTRASWSRQVIAAVRETHPEAFDATEDAA